jgi:hypothetical protein
MTITYEALKQAIEKSINDFVVIQLNNRECRIPKSLANQWLIDLI